MERFAFDSLFPAILMAGLRARPQQNNPAVLGR